MFINKKMVYSLTIGGISAIVVIFIIGGILVQNINAQSPCKLMRNQQGICVPVAYCPEISNILTNAPKPLPTEIANHLRTLVCDKKDNKYSVCCRQPAGINFSAAEFQTTTTLAPVTTTTTRVVTIATPVPMEPLDISTHPKLALLPTEICGMNDADRISNGQLADLYEFPWMALLRYNISGTLGNNCGGSIINSRYVLTAAHCVKGILGTRLQYVVLGEYNTATDEDCTDMNGFRTCLPPRQEIPIETTISHEQYNRPLYANDIGLVRTRTPISFDDESIQPVCLPFTWELQTTPLEELIVSGWGTTELKRPSQVLLKGTLGIISLDECRVAYKRVNFSYNQICARGSNRTDTCTGDSGGPLVYHSDIDGPRMVQYGIVSAGAPGCGDGASPGIYVKVQNYMPWILDNIHA